MKAAFLIAITLTAVNFQNQAASHAPKPAPKLYVSQKFGLVMQVPSGLSFCPLPKDWSGNEDGTVLFLKPPSACLAPRESSATRPIDGFVRSISLRYQVNRSRDDAFDGNIPAPRTSEEFAQQFCAAFSASPDLKLFDQPALTCRSELPGNKIRIALVAVYGSSHSNLVLSLSTTPDRLQADKQVLATIASSITACQPSSAKEKREKETCPKGNWW
jgi:hypothetical protein